MCGFITYPHAPGDEVLEHLEAQKHRGSDGYGAMDIVTGFWVKAMHPGVLLDMITENMNPKHGVIVHHRKTSIGGTSLKLAHPLTSPDERSTVVMQNGTKRDLAGAVQAASDTEAIALMYPLLSSDQDMVDSLLEGAGVVFVYHADKLLMYHDGLRSFHYCVSGSMRGSYSSEPISEGVWKVVPEFIGGKRLSVNMSRWQKALCPEAEEVKYEGKKCSVCHEVLVPVSKYAAAYQRCASCTRPDYYSVGGPHPTYQPAGDKYPSFYPAGDPYTKPAPTPNHKHRETNILPLCKKYVL